jgi:hypothetical protein
MATTITIPLTDPTGRTYAFIAMTMSTAGAFLQITSKVSAEVRKIGSAEVKA